MVLAIKENQLRVGLGHDLHRLVPGRKLLLGGVEVEFDKGPLGHSDGDVLLHAIIDALLGAAGLGDIGEWFPNTDEQWKDADSSQLLTETVSTIHENGWQVANLDCTIAAEQPKLSAYKPRIRENLARLLQVSVEAVNVKAKTGEGVGPIGRGEAVAADAVVLLIRDESRE